MAYVFPRWPVADVARAGAAGFRGSLVFRVSGAPRVAPGQAGYED
jgi:hypothetical protein